MKQPPTHPPELTEPTDKPIAFTPEMSPQEAADAIRAIAVTEGKAQEAMNRLADQWEINGRPTLQTFKDCLVIARFSRAQGIRDLVRGVGIEVIRQCLSLSASSVKDADRLRRSKGGTRGNIKEIAILQAEAREVLKVINDVNKTLLAAEGTLTRLPEANDQPDVPTAASFTPGQKVSPITVVTQNAHFHDTKPPEPAKPQ